MPGAVREAGYRREDERGTPFVPARVSWWQEATVLADELANLSPDKTDNAALLTAVRAAESKKANDIRVLDLRGITSFADHFVICHGTNARQIQAISDAVGEELDKIGERPVSVEGYQNAEWILMDYGDFLVHIFSEKAREYYDLERLWRHAEHVALPTPKPA